METVTLCFDVFVTRAVSIAVPLKLANSSDDDGFPRALREVPLDVPSTRVVSIGSLEEELTNAYPFAGIAVFGVIVISPLL